MNVTEFFRYLLGHEPSTGLAVQLLETYSARVVDPCSTSVSLSRADGWHGA